MEDKVRAEITYRMEKVDEYGKESAEDVLTMSMARARYEDLRRAMEDIMNSHGNAYSAAQMLVWSIAKLRGYKEGFLVDVRKAGEDGLLRCSDEHSIRHSRFSDQTPKNSLPHWANTGTIPPQAGASIRPRNDREAEAGEG
jgi:hypothetical protein